MPYSITTAEYLEISAYPLATPAVQITSLMGLWTFSYRGSNRVVDGVSGTEGNPHRLTETHVLLPGVVSGDFDSTGAPTPGVRAGLATNLDELFTNVLDEVTVGDGSRPALWHRGDGTVVGADIQVTGFEVTSKEPTKHFFDLDILVLPGKWTLVP